MRATINKIHPLQYSERSKNHFIRVEFKLADYTWAKTDLVPEFRNFERWRRLLKVGMMLDGIELKRKGEVNADCYPRQYEIPDTGDWVQNADGAMMFIRKAVPEIKTFTVQSETEKKKTYNAAMTETGIICDCPAYRYRGYCKHALKLKPLFQTTII